jgi:Immunity protein 7
MLRLRLDELIARIWDARRVYERHGWAKIRMAPSSDDVGDLTIPSTLARVRELLAVRRGVANEAWDLRANRPFHLLTDGDHNHADPGVVQLYQAVTAAATGSYRVPYVHDDDRSNRWDRWVIRRGPGPPSA